MTTTVFKSTRDYLTAWDWVIRYSGPLTRKYAHDCPKCILVAVSDDEDVYLCPKDYGYKNYEVLARFSGEGSDYSSYPLVGLMDADQLRTAPTWALVVAQGLLSGHLSKKGAVRIEQMP